MVVGQAGGIEEDSEGLPWIGQAGQWLTSLLDIMGLHSSTIYWTNIIKCFPGRKRGKGGGDNEPPPYAVEACQGYLIEEMRLVDPDIIVAVGAFAMKWFGIKGGIKINSGRVFDTKYGRVIPILHPAGIFRHMADAPMLPTALHSILTQLADPIEPPKFVEATKW
ncbi:hypothetical protein LCGC14_0364370 [marine sediment metagenome]|uniref:Uracil-DNA glycosylase-like domain-containing protein n=1 Tax=marine sediment metagenome TaxID=412755 RepID=A0A0F9VUF2_9ZZZZ